MNTDLVVGVSDLASVINLLFGGNVGRSYLVGAKIGGCGETFDDIGISGLVISSQP
jgi:hypothetical protein